jgi:hypothetical protein
MEDFDCSAHWSYYPIFIQIRCYWCMTFGWGSVPVQRCTWLLVCYWLCEERGSFEEETRSCSWDWIECIQEVHESRVSYLEWYQVQKAIKVEVIWEPWSDVIFVEGEPIVYLKFQLWCTPEFFCLSKRSVRHTHTLSSLARYLLLMGDLNRSQRRPHRSNWKVSASDRPSWTFSLSLKVKCRPNP